MAINLQTNFNSGELSAKLYGRSDLDIYRSGCRFLQNFFVLPQGGVERRPGTEFVQKTNSTVTGEKKARMIPFLFSSDESYACEFGNEYIRIWKSDGTYTDVTGTVPYSDTDVVMIDFSQRFDTVFLAHPGHPIQTLVRTTLAPTFEISKLDFDYPPFLEQNDDITSHLKVIHEEWATATVYSEFDQKIFDEISYVCTSAGDDQTSTDFATDLAAGWWALQVEQSISFIENDLVVIKSDSSMFVSNLVGSVLRIRHALSEDKVIDSRRLSSSLSPGYGNTNLIGYGNKAFISIHIKKYDGWLTNTVIEQSPDGLAWVPLTAYDSGGNFTYETTLVSPNQYIRVVQYGYSITQYKISIGGNRRITDSFVADGTTAYLDVSFCKWNVSTGGTDWKGVVEAERTTDAGKTWNTFIVVADTYGLEHANFKYSSPSIERGNTFIRVKYTRETGTIKLTIRNESSYTEGLIEVTEYVDSDTMKGIVLNAPSSAGYTDLWTESAFSAKRGYPVSLTFFEDRMWLAGSATEPSTIYASVSGDYYNFITGVESDLGIKRVPDTPEESRWMIGKRFLFIGTEGGAISIGAINRNDLVEASNIKTEFQSVFGASDVSAVLANDVVVYAQKNGLKLRELVYNWEEENFRSNDLTIVNDEILESGTIEMFLQKQPDQIVWCQKENGEIALLTYERQQEVVGWSRLITSGSIVSACAIPHESGEDEIWFCVLRNGSYLIEKMRPRSDADWFVDSGVYESSGDEKSGTISIEPDDKIKVAITGHGFSNGDEIKIGTCGVLPQLDGNTYLIADKNVNDFILKSLDDEYISFSLFTSIGEISQIVVTGATQTELNNTYLNDGTENGKMSFYTSDNSARIIWNQHINKWYIEIPAFKFETNSSNTTPPPPADWTDAGLNFVYTFTDAATITLNGASNTLDGLDHLEGDTVQVMADGIYISDEVVSGGSITIDKYASTIIAGLKYESILRPMAIEPILSNRLPNSRVKGIVKISIKFFRTIGAKVGEEGKQPSTYPPIDTTDPAGEPIETKTGETRLHIGSDWEREKVIEIKQDLPYPMTVLSMATCVEVKGG